MSRTRIIFFVILAIYVSVIGISLVSNLAGVRFLGGLFVASTLFSAGVVVLDFLGIFEGHHGDTAGDVTAGHIGDDASFGHGDAGHAGEDAGGPDHAAEAGEDVSAGHDGAEHGHDGEATVAQHHASAVPILSALTYLRLFVYFCLGFGPIGWIALASGRNPLTSLAMGTAIGVLAVFLAQAFFRIQRHDTDSQLRAPELVGRHGNVIVPLDDKTMGKVRVQVGLMVTEQYALAAQSGASFGAGEEVVVTRVTDECVYVR